MNISDIVKDLETIESELEGIRGITIFGSSRLKEDSIEYKKAKELGKALSDNGYCVITGGSGGIMEASNRGAKESGKSQSIGIHIKNLPNEERANSYLDKKLELNYFCTRKLALMNDSIAYIIMAGGFGTLDEFFEILNLIRTNNHKRVPIILFGSDYWSGLYKFITGTMLEYQTISREDLDIISLCDKVDEVLNILRSR
ncbi:MAG: TIGR00730 family Rossman fold protein [Epsilonproteobacteria bacterium]|nr:TIGR00730 family Rossman fold protein [Campylobacterota bacterium]